MSKHKFFILGYARAGKDEAARILGEKFGYKHESSSHFCLRLFVREQLEAQYGLKYETEEQCYADRVNHRPAWMRLIAEYNADDPSRLSRALLEQYDIYVGLRAKRELYHSRHLAGLTLWIDSTERLGVPPEKQRNSMVGPEDADVIIRNNGTIADLEEKLVRLFTFPTRSLLTAGAVRPEDCYNARGDFLPPW